MQVDPTKAAPKTPSEEDESDQNWDTINHAEKWSNKGDAAWGDDPEASNAQSKRGHQPPRRSGEKRTGLTRPRDREWAWSVWAPASWNTQ